MNKTINFWEQVFREFNISNKDYRTFLISLSNLFANVPRYTIEKILLIFFSYLILRLISNEKVNIKGFGTFKIKQYTYTNKEGVSKVSYSMVIASHKNLKRYLTNNYHPTTKETASNEDKNPLKQFKVQ